MLLVMRQTFHAADVTTQMSLSAPFLQKYYYISVLLMAVNTIFQTQRTSGQTADFVSWDDFDV